MATRFPAKQDPLFNLLDLYNQKEDYGKVISTLNRIEEKTGKNEQITMEKFRIYLQMKDDKKAFEEIESLNTSIRWTTAISDSGRCLYAEWQEAGSL